MTTGSLAKICNIVKPMRKSHFPISPFKREKLDTRLLLSLLYVNITCIVRVISAARFENTWPVHSANFQNGMETGLNYNDQTQSLFPILNRQFNKVLSAIFFTKSFYFVKIYTFQPSNTLRKENGSDYKVLLQ